ncbi:hypothetical protein AB0L75_24325 [Streptomyces sp. NPDC052101]|uniref:hypothetical protein n=1 Tax=Streptomyces sp. NPDC052101 TaxID=3155763 RepID=UPI0034192315
MRQLATTIGLVAVTGLAFTGGTANAAPTTHSASTVTQVAAESCPWTAKAHESVRIHKDKKLNSTALGLLPKGAKPKLLKCEVSIGGTYSLCKWKDDNRWDYISYRGIKGWVPLACVV